jgi:hypothetical protein
VERLCMKDGVGRLLSRMQHESVVRGMLRGIPTRSQGRLTATDLHGLTFKSLNLV